MIGSFSSAIQTDCPAIPFRYIIVSLDLLPAVRTDISAFSSLLTYAAALRESNDITINGI